jgi:hypothetical protein
MEKVDYVNVETGFDHFSESVGHESKDIGTGRYFEGGHQSLIFDALDDMYISSVKVFSNKEAMRSIVVLDAAGNLIHEKSVIIGEGEHRVNLDFLIPQGTDYVFGLYSDAYLWRNDGGATYPYQVDNLVSITKSTASTGPTQYYYYYYDWEVRQVGCSLSNDVNDLADAINIFPNPSSDYLFIELDDVNTDQISIYDAVGNLMQVDINKNPNQIYIDVSTLSIGTYFVRIDNNTHKFIKK